MGRCAAIWLALFLGLVSAASGHAYADEFNALRGQTIRVIIAHRAGNTTDTMARLFAARMAELVPDASVNVQNLDGSGGTLAMNEIHGARGSFITIGFVNSSVVFSQVTQGDQMPYDLNDFHWIGALASSQRVLVVRKGALDRADPAHPAPDAKPLVSLATTASAQNYVDGLILNATTPLRLKMVVGFKTEQQDAMLLAGDSDAGIGTYENFRKFIESGDVVPVLKFGTTGYPEEAAELPTLADVASPNAPEEVIAIATKLSDMGRYLLAAPATSTAHTEALAALFERIVADPAYLQGMKEANFIGSPQDGQAVTAFMKDLLANASVQAAVKGAIACGQEISDGVRAACD
jgi:tripartite-type tricarboxylate transporter receptor subunit TctC